MKTETKIQLRALDGDDASDEYSLHQADLSKAVIIRSNDLDYEWVDIVIDDTSYSVNASDLAKAIENATNIN